MPALVQPRGSCDYQVRGHYGFLHCESFGAKRLMDNPWMVISITENTSKQSNNLENIFIKKNKNILKVLKDHVRFCWQCWSYCTMVNVLKFEKFCPIILTCDQECIQNNYIVLSGGYEYVCPLLPVSQGGKETFFFLESKHLLNFWKPCLVQKQLPEHRCSAC